MRRTAAVLALFACLALAPAARADGARAYWVNYNDSSISWANLDGPGGATLDDFVPGLAYPQGLDLNLATGKVWWGSQYSWTVSSAALDLTPGVTDLPAPAADFNQVSGVAVDPVTGRIWWVNFGNNAFPGNSTIYSSKPDGSDPVQLDTTGATVLNPSGIALDPVGGRVWWTNYDQFGGGDSISYANMDGSGGGGTLDVTGATMSGPYGLAIDRVRGKVWWANLDGDKISYANLDGSGGGGDLVTGAAPVAGPVGIAIDPVTSRIWWANYNNDTLAYANADGSGGGGSFTPSAPATIAGPDYPVLVRGPRAANPPTVSGGAEAGATLSCAGGSWAADATGTFFYSEPTSTSLQWTRDGVPIPGATGPTVTADVAGSYACALTGSNIAGQTTQTSEAHVVSVPAPSNDFQLLTLKKNKKKGTATLVVGVPSGGKLTLWGKKARRFVKYPPGTGEVKFAIKPKKSLRKTLQRKGKAKIAVKVKYRPNGGTARVKRRSVTLRQVNGG